MKFVRTVLGDIAPESLGVCYSHEHVIIDRSLTTDREPGFLLDSVERAVEELKKFHADGGRAMVDSMPCDSGRNVVKMAAVSTLSGVHLIVPTGLHLAKYYDSGHWGQAYSEEELAKLFLADIVEGIDARDYNGPLVERTPHRAGIIKVATMGKFTPREERIFTAAALVHHETGCPILTHTEQGEGALEQVEQLQRDGVSLSHVVLSHTDRKPDLAYHREILSTGVRVEFDSAFRYQGRETNPTLKLVLDLIDEFPSQILLGMDAARSAYWASYGGSPGLTFLLTSFSAELSKAGLSHSHWKKIFIENPAEAYTFREME